MATSRLVFPTRVGMVRDWDGGRAGSGGFPHPRGDGPRYSASNHAGRRFSPPAWGWSVLHVGALRDFEVFPTRVGMVRMSSTPAISQSGFPHPRGDGPSAACSIVAPDWFSPPAWGWSAMKSAGDNPQAVFPTRVGMVRRRSDDFPQGKRFPHPRGDGPYSMTSARTSLWFSPPAWGWSDAGAGIRGGAEVFPTRVGMVRVNQFTIHRSPCFPHPRGDGPVFPGSLASEPKFSPPAWGWSELDARFQAQHLVFPTRVGMVRLQHRAA